MRSVPDRRAFAGCEVSCTGKSLRLFWTGEELDIRLHLLFRKVPCCFLFAYLFVCCINNIKSLGDFFWRGRDESPECKVCVTLGSAGCWVGPAPLCVSGFRRPGRYAHRTFDKFLPAGGSCGPVHAAPHPLPPPECARPAPLPLSLGLFRKHWELRFLRNCSVASVIRPVEKQTSWGVECVCGREQDAVGVGGGPGTSRFGVQAGPICILVDHFLTVWLCASHITSLSLCWWL